MSRLEYVLDIGVRKINLALIIFVFLIALFSTGENSALGSAVLEDSWTTVTSLPIPSDFIGAASLDGKIYCIGYNRSERYDPDTNSWSSIASLPVYTGSAVVACKNKIYVIGGNPTQVYDPTTDTWENRTSIPKTIYRQQANVIGDKIYVIFGQQSSPLGIINPSDVNYVYDTTKDSWTTMASIPLAVEGYASAVLDDKLYIIGGGTGTSIPNKATIVVQIFDPEKNQWNNGKSLPTGVFHAAACSTSGLIAPERIYVVGGSLSYDGGGLSVDTSSQTATNITQVYDPITGSWSLAASMSESRRSFSLITINDILYAVGNIDGNNSVEAYIPVGYDESLLPTDIPSPTSQTFAPEGLTVNLLIITVVICIVTIAIVILITKLKGKKLRL
ncbi:MAG: Kelch repeat-containing protein [Candidatus Bathyarchaeia archaeon]